MRILTVHKVGTIKNHYPYMTRVSGASSDLIYQVLKTSAMYVGFFQY